MELGLDAGPLTDAQAKTGVGGEDIDDRPLSEPEPSIPAIGEVSLGERACDRGSFLIVAHPFLQLFRRFAGIVPASPRPRRVLAPPDVRRATSPSPPCDSPPRFALPRGSTLEPHGGAVVWSRHDSAGRGIRTVVLACREGSGVG